MYILKNILVLFGLTTFVGTAEGCFCSAKNCEWTWSSWSQCNCNNQKVRDILITRRPSCGGSACPTNGEEKQSCTSQHSTPATLEDLKDAAWASKIVFTVGDDQVNKPFGDNGYRITHVVSKRFRGDTVKFLVAEKHDTVIVSFRGSFSDEQIFEQIRSFLFNIKGKEVIIAGMKTRVFKYPWDAMNILKVELSKIPSVVLPTKRVLITGHSFGGALASLFAADTMAEKNSWLITFGQPRVGDEIYARTHDQIFPPIRKLRVINEMDILPHLPPRIPIKYTHHSRGLWLKEQGKWMVCRRLESSNYCGDERMFDTGDGSESSAEYLLGRVINKVNDHALSKYIAKLNNPANNVKYCSESGKCQVFTDLDNALKSVCKS